MRNSECAKVHESSDAQSLLDSAEKAGEISRMLRESGDLDLASELEAVSKQLSRASISKEMIARSAEHETALANVVARSGGRPLYDHDGPGRSFSQHTATASAAAAATGQRLREVGLGDEAIEIGLLGSELAGGNTGATQTRLTSAIKLAEILHSTGALQEAAEIEKLVQDVELALASQTSAPTIAGHTNTVNGTHAPVANLLVSKSAIARREEEEFSAKVLEKERMIAEYTKKLKESQRELERVQVAHNCHHEFDDT